MLMIETVEQMRSEVGRERQSGNTIGFVPTMGFLHDGHLELIRKSVGENDRTVVSVFVNPLQFGPSEDFNAYPRDRDRDVSLAGGAGADYVFAPDVSQIYPHGDINTKVEVGRIAEVGEGKYRPGHFGGVATVCTKLFSIVRADNAYFGEKDAQQVAVIEQVVADLDLGIRIVRCATVREPDGLAMSSRNKYLDPNERMAAAVLPTALLKAAALVAGGERLSSMVKKAVLDIVSPEPKVQLQYVEVVDPITFEEVEAIEGRVTIAVAAFVGKTRLIDNVSADVGTGQPA